MVWVGVYGVVTTTTEEVMTVKTYEMTIPRRFFEDTFEADCFFDVSAEDYREMWSQKGSKYTVSLSERDAQELVSRADYYDDAATFWHDYRGLVLSARATLKAVYAQCPELRRGA